MSRIRTIVAIVSLAMTAWAADSSLDSNGMSALNHARYQLEDCERFTELKKSGGIEYDYIDQILAGKTIAVAIRSGQPNDRCESRSLPSMDLLKNYPAPLDERENPIERMDKLDKMVCTAKKKPGCEYFHIGDW